MAGKSSIFAVSYYSGILQIGTGRADANPEMRLVASNFSLRYCSSKLFWLACSEGPWCKWQHVNLSSWKVRVRVPPGPRQPWFGREAAGETWDRKSLSTT